MQSVLVVRLYSNTVIDFEQLINTVVSHLYSSNSSKIHARVINTEPFNQFYY